MMGTGAAEDDECATPIAGAGVAEDVECAVRAGSEWVVGQLLARGAWQRQRAAIGRSEEGATHGVEQDGEWCRPGRRRVGHQGQSGGDRGWCPVASRGRHLCHVPDRRHMTKHDYFVVCQASEHIGQTSFFGFNHVYETPTK